MKKILFYGNCQLGTLSKHIRDHTNEYEILNCQNYGLEKFWMDEGLFATWSAENVKNQDKYYSRIIEAVRTCDFFIFQHHKDLVRRKELTTEFLINQLNDNSVHVCLPSIRYYGYLCNVDKINPVIKRLYEQGMKALDILYYLKNEDDHQARSDMEDLHKSSIQKLAQKDEENKKLYKNYIPMTDFIDLNYHVKLISYDHSHPSIHYYNEILIRLKQYGIKIDSLLNAESKTPASNHICPYDLKYFNEHYINMEDKKKHDSFFRNRLNEENVRQQIELIQKGKIE